MSLPHSFASGLRRLVFPVVWLLAGCQSSDPATVNALSRASADSSISYRLVTDFSENQLGYLHQDEAERLVKAALSARGLYEAPDPARADIVVSLDFGMNGPRRRYEITPYRIRVATAPNGDRVYRTVNLHDVPYYVVGVEPVSADVVTNVTMIFEKYLTLTARENLLPDSDPAPEVVWSIALTSEGVSADLQEALPVLATAAVDFIGAETDGTQSVRLDANGDAVDFVRSLAAE